MLPLDPRKQHILKAIIEQFVQNAEPVGSKTILVNYNFQVSPATIRNDMVFLEKEGYITQPHTSAGRIPTDEGYKLFVHEMIDIEKTKKKAVKHLESIRKQYFEKKLKEKVYDAVSILAQAVNNISFATLPNNKRTFYIGVSNIIKQPEFQREPLQASQVVEVLEENKHFIKTLNSLKINDKIRIFIGEDNLINQIESCALIVCKYKLNDYQGYIGILGPKRMHYPFNAVILEEVRNLLEN